MKRPCSTVGMQAVHGFFRAVTHEYRQNGEAARDGVVNFFLLGLAGRMQDVIHNLVAIAGMVNTDAQTVEIFTAECSDDVTQTIMATVAATVFKFDRTFRQI